MIDKHTTALLLVGSGSVSHFVELELSNGSLSTEIPLRWPDKLTLPELLDYPPSFYINKPTDFGEYTYAPRVYIDKLSGQQYQRKELLRQQRQLNTEFKLIKPRWT